MERQLIITFRGGVLDDVGFREAEHSGSEGQSADLVTKILDLLQRRVNPIVLNTLATFHVSRDIC